MGSNQFTSALDALNDLRGRGFTDSFKVEDDLVRSTDTDERIHPDDFTIVEYHRFEGESNPDDMSVVYALESRGGRRGIIVDAYGTYSNGTLAEFLKKVKMKSGLK